MKRIVVTGANGYIGSHVVKALCTNKKENIVIAVDKKMDKIDSKAIFLEANIFDDNFAELLNNAASGSIDTFIHLAWKDGFNHNADSHIQDIYSHYQLIRNVIENGCDNVSVMGSMHEVGYYKGKVDEFTSCNPLSPYGIAKNALRQLLLSYAENKSVNLKWLRAFYITGNDQGNNSIFSKIIQMEKEEKKFFPFTDGKNQYDFIEVTDLALQIAKAAMQIQFTGIINVCSGNPVSLKEKVEKFIKENNYKIRPQYGAFPSRKYDSPLIYGDNAKILQIMMEGNA